MSLLSWTDGIIYLTKKLDQGDVMKKNKAYIIKDVVNNLIIFVFFLLTSVMKNLINN